MPRSPAATPKVHGSPRRFTTPTSTTFPTRSAGGASTTFSRIRRISTRRAGRRRGIGRETGLAEGTPLARWVEVAAKRVRPGGSVTFIHRAERLPDLLATFSAGLGSLRVLPLAPRTGRAARLVLMRGTKGGRGQFRLEAPLTLHSGAQHVRDGEDYAPEVSAILRDGASLRF